ncbi:MAG: ABC transporter permease [Clostridiales bacterium]|nr:ABC transporter permease [Clostridiales bacterium]
MSIGENITQAIVNIKTNKMRAILTMLGIIIGVAAVIAIMMLGNTMSSSISTQMQSLGVNNITVYVQQRDQTGNQNFTRVGGNNIQEKDLITDSMLNTLRQKYSDSIQAFSLTNSVGSGQTTSGSKSANLNLIGTSPEYNTANNLTLTQGRFILQTDADNRRNVAVVSDKLVSAIFGDANPIGQSIFVTVGTHINNYAIIGVYQSQAQNFGGGTTASSQLPTDVYIPLSTAQRITGSSGYQSAVVMTKVGVNATDFSTTIQNMLNQYYVKNINYQVSTFTAESMVSQVTSMLNMVSIMIAAIAAISLLVGGIGVMNIMLVSITERTREIGVRKALGATNGAIRGQFIIEAIVICFIGGVVGIVLGLVIGTVGVSIIGGMMGSGMTLSVTAPVSTIFLATGISIAIGVFFGYYPANNAAKLDPIDALRYE